MTLTKQQIADLLKQVEVKKHSLSKAEVKEAIQRSQAKRYGSQLENPLNSKVVSKMETASISEIRQYYKRCEAMFCKGKQGGVEDCLLKAWHNRINPVFKQMYAEWERYAREVEAELRSKKDKPKRPWM